MYLFLVHTLNTLRATTEIKTWKINCGELEERIREESKIVSLGLVCGRENSSISDVAAAYGRFIYVKCNVADRLLELVGVVAVATSSLARLNLLRRGYTAILNKLHTFPELILSRTELPLEIALSPLHLTDTFSDRTVIEIISSLTKCNVYF
jgi:hypothetical protein